MKEVHKQYEVKGMLFHDDKVYPHIPMYVSMTKDKMGCTVSIGCAMADIQFSVPFDEMLKDLIEPVLTEIEEERDKSYEGGAIGNGWGMQSALEMIRRYLREDKE